MIDQFGNYVPEWVQFDDDEDQTPDMGPLAQALKNRFASNKKSAPEHLGIEHEAIHANPTTAPHIDTTSGIGGHEAKGFGGGGMKSL